MISRATPRFEGCFDALPADVREQARAAYRLWAQNPAHPSLRFKKIHPTRPIYSVRIGLGWRAIAVRSGDTLLRFWIGSNADYDRLVSRL